MPLAVTSVIAQITATPLESAATTTHCDEPLQSRAFHNRRLAAMPWNVLWQRHGQVQVIGESTVGNGERATQIQHLAGDPIAAGATARVYRGQLVDRSGETTEQVVVKYYHTMTNMDGVRVSDGHLDHAATRQPLIRSLFLSSLAWCVGPVEALEAGHAYAPCLTVQRDLSVDPRCAMGQAMHDRVRESGNFRLAAQAGAAMASSLLILNRRQPQGSRLFHSDWKWQNLAFRVDAAGRPTAALSFDNASIRMERGPDLVREFTPLYVDFATIRSAAFDRSIALGTAGRTVDRLHSYAVAANLVDGLRDTSGCTCQDDLRRIAGEIPGPLGDILCEAMDPLVDRRLPLREMAVRLAAIGGVPIPPQAVTPSVAQPVTAPRTPLIDRLTTWLR